MADSRGRYDQTGFDQGRFNKSKRDTEEDSIEWDTPTSVSDFGSFGAKAGGFFGSSSTREEEDNSTPSWFDSPIDSSNGRGKVGHSVREFEEWKAKMKIEELKKQGFDVDESEITSESFNEEEDFFSNEHGHTTSSSSSLIDSKHQPEGKSVDRLFSMWDEGMSSKAKAEDHSRFSRSRFFGASGSASQTPPTQHPPANISDSAGSPAQSSSEIPQGPPKDADKEGFQRIMMMLGNGLTPPPPGIASDPADRQQLSQPQPPHQRAPEATARKPAGTPSGAPLGDDLFFQTLLNKGGQQPASPASVDLSSRSSQEHPQSRVKTGGRSTDQAETPVSHSPMPGHPPRMLIDKDGNPFFPPPPPGMFVDKDGNPLPPEFMPYPPPMMFDGQQYPMPPPPFFGGPGGPPMHSPSAAGQVPAQMHGGFPGPNVGNNNWNRQPTH